MPDRAVAVLLLLVGGVNILPVVGVLGASRLTDLYGLPFAEPNLLILMRHRAVLFGIVGGILIYAAFNASLRPLATIIGFVSMVSFVLLTLGVDGVNAELRRVIIADVVASVMLGIAYMLNLLPKS